MEESIYSFKPRYDRELELLKEAGLSERNHELILGFHSQLFAKGVSEARVIKLSWQLRNIASILQMDFDKATAEDLQKVMVVINTQRCTMKYKTEKKYSASTKADYGRALKQFYRWLKKTKHAPPEVEWIRTRVSLKDKKLGVDLIDWADIEKASQNATNSRDKAFIHLLYESGGRIGEILSMRIQDVVFKERYAKVRLNGKTGERWVPIVTSVPLLAAYLNTHPFRQSQNSAFWLCGANRVLNKPLKYNGAVMLIRRLFRAAEISKRCNPHTFRHSRATELCKRMTETQLRLYFGWEKGSDTPAVYTHLSGRDVDEAVLGMYGIIEKEANKNEKPQDCHICKAINNSQAMFCSACGYTLSGEKAIQVEEQRKQEIEKTFEYFYEIAKNPELMKKFEEFKVKTFNTSREPNDDDE